jgi:predicted PurR-regulated permease PerM
VQISRTLWRLLFAAILAGIALAAANLLVSTLSVVLLTFAGILFGVFLNGISRFVKRHTPLPYLWSYVLVVTVLLLLIAGGFIYLGATVTQQAAQLSEQLQSAANQLMETARQYPWIEDLLSRVSEDGGQLSGQGGLLPRVMAGAQWVLWGVTGIVVIFFVGLYVAYDPELYETGLVKLVPANRRDHACDVLRTLRSAVASWIVGQFISMSIIGVFTMVGLWLLGVPMAIALGVLAALLTFIPNFGPILATIPQALLALQVGTNTVLYVLLLNVGLQTVESYVVTPIVQRYEATLPPALTIFAQLLMGAVVGVIGVVMAAPLTVASMALVQMLYIRDELGDPEPGELVEEA